MFANSITFILVSHQIKINLPLTYKTIKPIKQAKAQTSVYTKSDFKKSYKSSLRDSLGHACRQNASIEVKIRVWGYVLCATGSVTDQIMHY